MPLSMVPVERDRLPSKDPVFPVEGSAWHSEGLTLLALRRLFDISISIIDCRYINTFEEYRYRYRYGHFENIDIDKAILENIDIDKAILKISISISISIGSL